MSIHPFKEFREKHELGQSELGLLLGIEEPVAQGRISHYECGRRKIPTNLAMRFVECASDKGETYSLENIYSFEAA